MPAASDSSRPYHHGRLRETLVEAGLGLARSGGPDAVVLRAVSREAGVSHNAAYRHFADHDELLGAVAKRCMQQLAALMTERTAAVRTRGAVPRAWARFEAIGRAYVEFARTEPGWFRTAFTTFASPPTAADARAEADLGEDPNPYTLLSQRLDELVAAGAVPAQRRPGAEHVAWSAVHGLSCLLVDGPLRALGPDEVEAALTTVLAAVERGL